MLEANFIKDLVGGQGYMFRVSINSFRPNRLFGSGCEVESLRV